jgi:hypothetical protein
MICALLAALPCYCPGSTVLHREAEQLVARFVGKEVSQFTALCLPLLASLCSALSAENFILKFL